MLKSIRYKLIKFLARKDCIVVNCHILGSIKTSKGKQSFIANSTVENTSGVGYFLEMK